MNFNEQDNEAAIFEEVLSANTPAAIELILDRRCGTDSKLRARILALLESYHSSEYLERFQAGVFDNSLTGTNVGKFQIMDLLGQGGMGDVYSARRVDQPREIVALKVIKPGMDTRQIIARFNLERETLRRFDHPHIARFIDSGVDATGRIYFAMELIQGMSIVDYCDLHRMSIQGRLRLFLDVCSAVSHAHGIGVIHRDLKPQNVLVTQRDGVAVVKVIDFGVAKALSNDGEADSRLTGALQWIGTPKYMSPEQLAWSSDVDARTDVFSLGVMLYELLTGSTPLKSEETSNFDLSMLRSDLLNQSIDFCSQRIASYKSDDALRHAANRSTAPQSHVRAVRGNVDRITHKALERHRDQRYLTAGQLADDVSAYLQGGSISLKQPTIVENVQRWRRRHPKAAARTIGAGVVLAIFGLVFSAIWEIRRANHASEVVGKDLEQASFVQNIQSASQFIFSGDTASAKKSLREYLWDKKSSYANHFVPRLLQGMFTEASQRMLGHDDDILDMDISENRRWLASVDRGGNIILWDRQTGKDVHRARASNNETTRVRFRPHGNLLATAGQDTLVRLWDSESLELVDTLSKHQRTINGLAWSPDGKLLVTGDREGFVYIWDVDKRICLIELPEQSDTVRCIEWSPDGKHLAVAIKNIGVQLWETQGWSKISEFSNAKDYGALAIAFSHDSQYMVYGGYKRTLSFIDMNSLSIEQEMGTPHDIYSIQFGRNLEVFVGESYGIVQLFQRSMTLDSWVPTRLTDLSSKSSTQRSIRLDEDADIMLAAAEEHKSIDAYPLSKLLGYQTKSVPTACTGTIAELGLRLLSDLERSVAVQDDYEHLKNLSFRASQVCTPAYSKVAQRIAIATIDDKINLVNATTLQVVEQLDLGAGVSSLHFSRSGQRLSICKSNGTVGVWDLESMSHWTAIELVDGNKSRGVFSPCDDLFIAGETGKTTIFSFDEITGKTLNSAKLLSGFENLCFQPNGKYLVVGEMGWLSVWASDLSKQLWRAPFTKNGVPGTVEAMCFAPEGDCLAVLLRDGTVEFWDMQSRVRFFAMQTPTLYDNSHNFCRWMSFNDNSTLWVSSEDGQKYFQLQAARN